MKVIDKRTKKNNGNYKYGDILMCYFHESNDYDLLRISRFYDQFYCKDRYIAVIITDSDGNEKKTWPGIFDSAKDLVSDLRNSFDHVEKVNAYIVIID